MRPSTGSAAAHPGHATRLTAQDEAIENAAFALAVTEPTGLHLIPPEPPERPT